HGASGSRATGPGWPSYGPPRASPMAPPTMHPSTRSSVSTMRPACRSAVGWGRRRLRWPAAQGSVHLAVNVVGPDVPALQELAQSPDVRTQADDHLAPRQATGQETVGGAGPAGGAPQQDPPEGLTAPGHPRGRLGAGRHGGQVVRLPARTGGRARDLR